MQESYFSADVPWTLPSQKVPATAQQILPAFNPPLIPLDEASSTAGHTPNSKALAPSSSLPQFLNSQQFCLVAIVPPFSRFKSVCHILSGCHLNPEKKFHSEKNRPRN